MHEFDNGETFEFSESNYTDSAIERRKWVQSVEQIIFLKLSSWELASRQFFARVGINSIWIRENVLGAFIAVVILFV